MGRLNYRLIFSLLAAGAILLTLLIPGTRPLTQRVFWLLSGTYLNRTGIDESDYASTMGMMDDNRLVLLLRGAGRLSVEGRSFEMSRIASQRKDAALWGHVIRETSTMPLGVTQGQKLSQSDLLRRDSMAQLALNASLEGQKLAPKNGFFYLSQAVALATMNRWDEILTPLEVGAKQPEFDDYTLDIARRQLDYLYKNLHPVLPSDLGGDWSMILMPHLSNYRSLSDGLTNITSETRRLAAGLALARIGNTITRSQDIPLLKYSGSSLVSRSILHLSGTPITSSEKIPAASVLVPKIAVRAQALGQAKDWGEFRDWKPFKVANQEDAVEALPIDVQPMLATQAMLVIFWITAIGACLWLGSQMELNFINIATGVAALIALTSVGLGLVTQPWLLIGWVWGSLLVFGSFATLRLPGKRQAAIIAGLGGATLMISASVLHGELNLGLFTLGLWLVPFALSYLIKWAAPIWFVSAVAFVTLAGAFLAVTNSLPRTPQTFDQNFVGSVQTLVMLTAYGLPLLVAYVMAIGKLNLGDSLRVILKPMPFFAVIFAGAFLWGTRQEMQLQSTWAQLTEKELPPSYKQVIEEAKKAHEDR